MALTLQNLVGISGMSSGGISFSARTELVSWRGRQFKDAVDTSAREIIKEFAKDMVIIAKSIVHVITGTLRRSIKADRPSNWRDRTEAAMTRDLGTNIPEPERVGKNNWALAVGPTTFYGIYEELLHPFIEPAFRAASRSLNKHISKHRLGMF